jgi:hypothetical protein
MKRKLTAVPSLKTKKQRLDSIEGFPSPPQIEGDQYHIILPDLPNDNQLVQADGYHSKTTTDHYLQNTTYLPSPKTKAPVEIKSTRALLALLSKQDMKTSRTTLPIPNYLRNGTLKLTRYTKLDENSDRFKV